MRQYLAVFNPLDFTPQQAIMVLDGLPGVADWLKFFDHAICFVSDHDPHYLTGLISNRAPNRQFLVVEMNESNKNGMLAPQVWSFINRHVDTARFERAGG